MSFDTKIKRQLPDKSVTRVANSQDSGFRDGKGGSGVEEGQSPSQDTNEPRQQMSSKPLPMGAVRTYVID